MTGSTDTTVRLWTATGMPLAAVRCVLVSDGCCICAFRFAGKLVGCFGLTSWRLSDTATYTDPLNVASLVRVAEQTQPSLAGEVGEGTDAAELCAQARQKQLTVTAMRRHGMQYDTHADQEVDSHRALRVAVLVSFSLCYLVCLMLCGDRPVAILHSG